MSDLQTFNDNILAISKKLLFNRYENDTDGTCTALINDLLELQKLASLDEEIIRWIDFVSSINSDVNHLISGFAMELYEGGRTELSCYAYIRCIQSSKDSAISSKNNLAYIIRRNEAPCSSLFSISEITDLLENGLENEDLFSAVNMALTFILRSGEEQDWRLADELFANLKENDIDFFDVISWWENVDKSGDVEGALVHFFLLRHKKIEKSSLGNIEQLSQKLSEEIKSFPVWLTVGTGFKSLDSIFETMLDANFEENLKEYLNNMPRNREAAEEILNEITQWDEWELYRVILQDYAEYLTKNEISKIISAYKKKFMTPLSDIIDEREFNLSNEDDTEE